MGKEKPTDDEAFEDPNLIDQPADEDTFEDDIVDESEVESDVGNISNNIVDHYHGPHVCPKCLADITFEAIDDDIVDHHSPDDDDHVPGDHNPDDCGQCAADAVDDDWTFEEAIADDLEKALVRATERREDGRKRVPKLFYLTRKKQQEMDTTTKWIIPNLLPLNATGALSGIPGTRKSFLILDLAVCIANNVPDFLGHPIDDTVRGRPVLYIAADDGSQRTVGRLRDIAKYRLGHADYDRIAVMHSLGFSVQNREEAWVDLITSYAACKDEYGSPPVLIVLDTASMVDVPVDDFGHSFAKVLGWLKEEVRGLDMTVIFVDHQAKPTKDNAGYGARLAGWGSNLKAGFLEYSWSLRPLGDDKLLGVETKDGPEPPKLLLTFSHEGGYGLTFSEAPDEEAVAASRKQDILATAEQPATIDDIVSTTGHSRSTVERTIRGLVKEGRMECVKEARSHSPALYKQVGNIIDWESSIGGLSGNIE